VAGWPADFSPSDSSMIDPLGLSVSNLAVLDGYVEAMCHAPE